MAGYALGKKSDEENEIQILEEDNENAVTYSQALIVNLFTYLQKDQLTIPYSTIKSCKDARLEGAREVIYYASDRPDNYQKIRSVLELWGFSSYVEYLYTVCELGFLEGLIPVIDLGFLKPDELRNLSEIAALVRVFMDNPVDYKRGNRGDVEKKLLYRKRNIEWCGKLNIPTITGFCISKDDNVKRHTDWVQYIADTHEKYGTIHEVVLRPITEKTGIMKELSKERIKEAYDFVREKLPEDILITIEPNRLMIAQDYIDFGIRDLGTIIKKSNNYSGVSSFDIDQAAEDLDKMNYLIHQRFPLRKGYIKQERYSKKLGQVFDAYKYKIKKETQEKLKESKV